MNLAEIPRFAPPKKKWKNAPHQRDATLARAAADPGLQGTGVRWTAALLPASARKLLMDAAQVVGDAREKAHAIDKAITYIHLHYPQFFQQEQPQ